MKDPCQFVILYWHSLLGRIHSMSTILFRVPVTHICRRKTISYFRWYQAIQFVYYVYIDIIGKSVKYKDTINAPVLHLRDVITCHWRPPPLPRSAHTSATPLRGRVIGIIGHQSRVLVLYGYKLISRQK